jgi:hypothetical protein
VGNCLFVAILSASHNTVFNKGVFRIEKNHIWIIFILLIVAYVTDVENINLKDLFSSLQESTKSYDKVVYFPADKYSKTAVYIEHAIDKG